MAELALKIKPNAEDEGDGDILVAVNDRRIKDIYAQHICHIKNAGFNASGLRPSNSLSEFMLQKTSQFKFQRISQTEIKKIDLATLTETTISGTPNKDREHMDVAAFIKRRVLHQRHLIFGEPGAEYWFGGNRRADHAKLDEVWTEIEDKTPLRKNQHTRWPFTDIELKHFLVLPLEDFTDIESNDLTAALYNEEGVPIKKRKNFIEWRGLIGKTPLENDPLESQILDKNFKVDVRGKGFFQRATLVKVKE